jgi:hypothetical protein
LRNLFSPVQFYMLVSEAKIRWLWIPVRFVDCWGVIGFRRGNVNLPDVNSSSDAFRFVDL